MGWRRCAPTWQFESSANPRNRRGGICPLFAMRKIFLETVAIHHPDSPAHRLVINKVDLSPDHKLWDEDVVPVDEPAAVPAPNREREGELQSMTWQQVRAIAEDLGIEKPEEGWMAAIPQILEAEANGSNQ